MTYILSTYIIHYYKAWQSVLNYKKVQMWHNNGHSCVYIYMWVCLCVFVDGWPKKGSYLQHLWPVSDSLWDLPLSILVQRPHKELGLGKSSTIMGIHVFIYIYIYIKREREREMYVCGSMCVFMDGWSKKGFYLQHFLPASDCLWDLPLSILVRRPHKELSSGEPARPQVKMKDSGELGMRLW